MPRKFFKQALYITVLSEDTPLEYDDLNDIHRAISDGDCVGSTIDEDCMQIEPREAAILLTTFGSEPAFFQLDDQGNDLAED